MRAMPIRRDKTSSFPSRAVVCAVVFSWLVLDSLAVEGILSTPLSVSIRWTAIIAVASLAAFARINVGAHYPSDTLFGFVLGCIVLTLGARIEQMWRTQCGFPDTLSSSSSRRTEVMISSWRQFFSLSTTRPFIGVTLISYAMTLISIQGFWVKCSYVYGLLMASIAFRATYVCGNMTSVAPVMVHGSMSRHIGGATMFCLLLIFGMATKGKKGPFRVIAFSLIYFFTIVGIVFWRLRPQDASLG